MQQMSDDVDVVIIGAGTAGIAAARRLAASHLSAIVLEATARSTGVALRRTGVRAKAVVPLRARNRLHRPEQALIVLPTEHRERRRTTGRGHSATQVHGEWGERQCRSASICWYRNFELCPANVGGARRSSVRPAPSAIRCPSCRAKGPLFDFIVDASDEGR